LEDVDLNTTGRILSALTHTFFVPISAHSILVVTDNKEHRDHFQNLTTETIDLPNLSGLSTEERNSLQALLTNVFGIANPTFHRSSITVRSSPELLLQAKDTLSNLYRPEAQVLLQIKAYTVTRTHNRNLGITLPPQVKIFNIATEAESLISSNASVVQELIQAGLVTAGDTLGIAEALIAGGYAGSSVLGSSSVYFGGGTTAFGVQFDSVDANASLSVSSVQELQEVSLHLADGQSGVFRVGQQYPVITTTTSAVSTSTPSVIPSFQYVDLGLTSEARPHIVSGNEVLLHLHESIRSLHGSSLNSIPILDSQEFSSDLTVPAGVTSVMVSNLSRTETLATQGILSSINTNFSRDEDDSELVITVTPVVTRPLASR